MASEKNRRLAQQMEERTSSHDNYRGGGPSSSRDYSPPRNRAPRPKVGIRSFFSLFYSELDITRNINKPRYCGVQTIRYLSH